MAFSCIVVVQAVWGGAALRLGGMWKTWHVFQSELHLKLLCPLFSPGCPARLSA